MTISSLGVGSNLDLSTLLTQLQTAESQPLVDLQSKQTGYTTKLTAYGKLSSVLSGFESAAAALGSPSLFQSVKAASSNTGVLTATGDSTAVAGSYSINVTQLAQSQSLVSAGQASATTAIGNGTITIDFGTVSGGTLDATTGKYAGATFTKDATRTAVPITIDASNNTLQGIRDAINAANAGVTATVVSDGSAAPERLVLSSTQTGAASSMKISVAGDAALQNLLANDPEATQNLTQTVSGQDAKLTVNGIAVSSARNTVKEAIQGTTLNLVSLGTSSVNLSNDTTSVSSAISAFVQAYNNLQSTATSLTAYNATTKTGAALMGDATLRNIQTKIRQALVAPQDGGSNDMKVLSEVGISFQKDGTLALDSDKLNKALSTNLAGVSKLFASADGSTAGYGKQLSSLVSGMTADGGALQVATDGVNATLKQLDTEYTAMSARVDDTVARYRTQFQQLDVLMSTMNSTMSYLTQQFNAMNGTTTSSSKSS
ncbi:flagellar hook-associated protein 2 [Variovorax sp. HW608]|uniref:flagellar filament capping protein FliD n=1 Tax=Variovorax sp. HW608 TaxID=1034889 RepID=UPI00081FE2E1|nr:flagellar filament capping protein FliD [Variovorax sp. HW608]SCK60179.1 flagellar hook-associated protein 2 [Variovorax sp. HW608]